MATQLFFRTTAATTQLATNNANLVGTNSPWAPRGLSTSRGAGVTSASGATVAGPTNGIEVLATLGALFEWISEPLDQDVTISGTITINLWTSESNMSANVAINAIIERLNSQGGIVSTIAQSSQTSESAVTTRAVKNFTVTPTSTAMLKGDRLRIRVFGDDSTANMGSGFTFDFGYDGTTAAADGDSYISFTETFGFLTTTPAGTQLFLTDVAGPAVGANIEKEMWTSRGDGVNSIVRNTVAGWTAPLQWTDSGGGTAVEWYSKPLQAFTLGDLVRCNLRAQASTTDDEGLRAEIAVCDSDGTNVTIWGAGNYSTATDPYGPIPTTETALTVYVAGDDLAVTNGQRVRLRVFIDDMERVAMVASQTATLFYDGTSGGASGDSWIQLSQSVSEFSSAPPVDVEELVALQAVGRSAFY